MKLIKNHFGTVVKLWINQAGSILFGAFLLLPSMALSEKVRGLAWVLPLASFLSAVFYLTLIFWVSCELGLHDSVSIDAGRTKRLWYKGTVLSLAANAPAIVAALVQTVSKLFIPGVSYFASVSGAKGAGATVHAVSMMINEILHIMYQGMLVFFGFTRVPFIYLPVILFSVLTCTFGYLAGTRGFLANLLSKDARKRDER